MVPNSAVSCSRNSASMFKNIRARFFLIRHSAIFSRRFSMATIPMPQRLRHGLTPTNARAGKPIGTSSDIWNSKRSLGNTAFFETSLLSSNFPVRRAIVVAEEIEGGAEWHGLAEPSTFSYLPARALRYPTEEAIPPTIPPPSPDHSLMGDGIYVTVTGIPGLERLYREAKALGMKLYSNDPKAIPASERLLPHAVVNPHIKLQFARSGWGSVWLSQLSGTPLVVPDFDPADDPEIYFNNRCVEMLGLGIVWRGQSLGGILADGA